MNYYFCIIALALVPFSLSAQTKPTARKSVTSSPRTSAARPNAARITPVPDKKVTSATSSIPGQPAPETPVKVVAQPTQAEPVVVATAQPITTSRLTAPTNAKESHFRIGVRLGGNSATIGGVDVSAVGADVQLASVTGFHGGVVFNIGGSTFSVQPEILFTQYGVRLVFGSDYLQIKYNVVEVPVLFKASFGSPNLRFFVNAGPVATYAMSGTISVREDGQSDSQTVDMSQQGRFSYGASGGVGVSLKAGPGSVLVEGRYSYLMATQDDGSKTKPQNAMLSVGYLIPLGGR